MIVDLGTGDGRAVVRRAAAAPGTLVIGVDASAPAMADASRRAARRGPRNALFFAASVEGLGDTPLAGSADLVTVTLPWGSLLRAALGRDDPALTGLAAVLAPTGRLEALVSVVPSDRVAGLDCLDRAAEPTIRRAWNAVGLELDPMAVATPAELAASGSSWARRLGSDRPVWRLTGRRLG